MRRAPASSLRLLANLWETAAGAPSIDSTAMLARGAWPRFSSWAPPTQPDTANPSNRTATLPKRWLQPTRAALAAGWCNPLCIDFPAGARRHLIFVAKSFCGHVGLEPGPPSIPVREWNTAFAASLEAQGARLRIF